MKIKLLLLGILPFFALSLTAQPGESSAENGPTYKKVQRTYRYRVYLTDKTGNGFSTARPEKFLSPKALARRAKYGLAVDEHDLPITRSYINALRKKGLKTVTQSKWNNTIVVETADTLLAQSARQLPFVKEVRCVFVGPDSVAVFPAGSKRAELIEKDSVRSDTLADNYGEAAAQIRQIGLDRLHEKGLRGNGVTIAVLDGGFLNTDLVKGLKKVNILSTRNFAHPEKSVYEEESHGTMVLSCIAANTPHDLTGTAPAAAFHLLVSEASDYEQEVEEDFWAAAIEYADSIGADIATSSLGYTTYDYEWMNRKYAALDGRTALASRTAALAASRGLLVVNSAGNSGMDRWKKIAVPADAGDILTVGAVDCDGENAPFSSIGNTADGRVKPDIMAMGLEAAIYEPNGMRGTANGTSFSCPIMCGAAACLVQAFPNARPTEIIHALQQSGNNATRPDNIYGYGIPDMEAAYQILSGKKQSGTKK